jgi:RimJ/RimL family protein N-acetyltransferase
MAEMQIRAATAADIDLIHRELADVIATSPHYSEQFKAHETGRLNKAFLRNLLALDPWHIMIMCADGTPGGAMVSGPDLGSVFRYWSWVFPSHRQTKLGMFGMRAFDEHWDNGRFHKAYTFVRPENEVARMLLRRYGYRETCLLEQHIFGQDYLLIEKPYTKVTEGYDSGMGPGRLGRLRQRMESIFGR